MEGWKCYEGKQVFIKLKNKREYSGKVLEVSISYTNPTEVFITINDKFGKRVTLNNSEIAIIQEEVKK